MFYGNITLVDRLAIIGHTGSDAIGLRPPTGNPDNPLSTR
jgi:hypothetical protein